MAAPDLVRVRVRVGVRVRVRVRVRGRVSVRVHLELRAEGGGAEARDEGGPARDHLQAHLLVALQPAQADAEDVGGVPLQLAELEGGEERACLGLGLGLG